MVRKILAGAVALAVVLAFTASTVEARHGNAKGNTVSKMGTSTCPFGNTPGSGLGKGYGPGDGTCTQNTPPRDGTGFGAIQQGKGKTNSPTCDGTGPKGQVKGKRGVKP
jgi:hypothetical protein